MSYTEGSRAELIRLLTKVLHSHVSLCHAGIVGMCKEHMGVALALKVPVFFVVTKVDICPEHVLKHTLTTLQAILKKPGVKKKPFMVGTCDLPVLCWFKPQHMAPVCCCGTCL